MNRFEWEQEVANDEPPKCERCQGTGEVPAVVAVQPVGRGWIGETATRTCPTCGGTGLAGTTKGKEAK